VVKTKRSAKSAQAIRRLDMTKRSDLKTSSAANGAATARSGLSTPSIGHPVQAGPAYRRPQIAIPVPTPSPNFQRVEDGTAREHKEEASRPEGSGLRHGFTSPLRVSSGQDEVFPVTASKQKSFLYIGRSS